MQRMTSYLSHGEAWKTNTLYIKKYNIHSNPIQSNLDCPVLTHENSIENQQQKTNVMC